MWLARTLALAYLEDAAESPLAHDGEDFEIVEPAARFRRQALGLFCLCSALLFSFGFLSTLHL